MPVNILCPIIWPPLCSSFSRDCVCQLAQVRNCGIFILVTTGRFEQTLCRLSSRRKATVFFSCLLPLFEKNPPWIIALTTAADVLFVYRLLLDRKSTRL